MPCLVHRHASCSSQRRVSEQQLLQQEQLTWQGFDGLVGVRMCTQHVAKPCACFLHAYTPLRAGANIMQGLQGAVGDEAPLDLPGMLDFIQI